MFEAPHCEQQAQKLIDGQAEPCTEQPQTRIAAAAQAPAVNHLRYLQEHDDRDEIHDHGAVIEDLRIC